MEDETSNWLSSMQSRDGVMHAYCGARIWSTTKLGEDLIGLKADMNAFVCADFTSIFALI